jgi:hypothetical protein
LPPNASKPTGSFGVKKPTTHEERHPDQLNENLLEQLRSVTTTYGNENH